MSTKKNKQRYFERRKDIVKLFDDLENFRDFCRFNFLPFNESYLYNSHSSIWNAFLSKDPSLAFNKKKKK